MTPIFSHVNKSVQSLVPLEAVGKWELDFDRDRHFRGIQPFAMIFLGASILSLIAWIVFLGTVHKFILSDALQDQRQNTRLLMAVVTLTYWYSVTRYTTSARIRPAFWNHLGLGVASFLITLFGMALTDAESIPTMKLGSEPRLGTTVLIFTLALYCVATPSKWLIAGGMLIAAFPIVAFNARYVSPVTQGSFINFLIGVHLIGMIVYSARRQQDLALFQEQSRVKKLVTELDAAAKRAEELSSAKTRLIAVVSHDLRQPLNSLGLYNNLLKSRFGGEKNVALNSIAERVQECVSAMDGNLSRLQEIAQLQSKRVIPTQVAFDLTPTLFTLESVFRPIAEAAGVTLRFYPSKDDSPSAFSNPERLFEILANLISNAIKFTSATTGRKGWVLVKVRKSKDGDRASQIRIDVRDNGIGIAPIHQETIFDEYVQLNNPERRGVNGYGLGLSVVRELCNSLEGHRVGVRSRLGAGACFTIWLPFGDSQPQRGPSKIRSDSISHSNAIIDRPEQTNFSSAPRLTRSKVLLIEDDESLRSALTAQLQELGAKVRAYPSAKHALAATANDIESPTCIISDYWLPEPFDGLQTIVKLREQFGEVVPALLISAASDIEPKRLESLPNLEFALKPVSANTLLSYVGKQHRLE